MPVTQITLLPGYPPEVRERLVRRVSDAVRSVIAAPAAGTTTFVQEVATYQRDGRVFTQGNAAVPVASEQVRAFLAAMQARDLSLAQTFLSPDFTMCFPGGARFNQLAELVAWGRQRYNKIGKHVEQIDEAWTAEHTVVHCHGTLFGEWPDGQAFEGIRFIDRFEVKGGLLCRQDVWNDLAEHARAAINHRAAPRVG
ncbi:MAG: nuclear transport factor 2 family protein [Pseudomonadota bacterium]